MKKQNQIAKKILVNFLIGSLIHLQTFNAAYAQQSVAQDVQMATNIVTGVASQVLSAKASAVNQQVAQAQLANLQKQLAPQASPSKYFPECQLPNVMNNFPVNACMVTTNPQQISQMFAYENISTQMSNYYDQMLNEATMNSTTGIKCLSDRKKVLDAQLVEMVNNLTRLQTQLKQESETFREGNKALLANLENTNSELFGTHDNGSGGNSVNAKTRDFSKLVSPGCQNVIGKDMMSKAAESGFNGLLVSTQSKNTSAGNFNQSKAQIELEIRNEVQTLKNSIAANGVDNWVNDPNALNNAIGNGTSYASVINKVKSDAANLASQKQRIASEMAKIYPNYSLPRLNQNASADLQGFINGSQDYFKKQYINNCATDSSLGVAIDIQKVVDSVQQRSTGNSVSAVSSYKTALQNILNNSTMLMSDKLDQIKALESTYPGITVTYTGSDGATTNASPYSLLSNTVAACTAKFAQDQTFAKAGNQGVSEQTKATRATALLQENNKMAERTSNTHGNDIVNSVINCNGETAKATDTCDESTVDSKSASFCMAKASSCASSITACYSEINTQVDKRKADMAKMASQYNANVQTMVNRANALYTSQQTNITGLLQNLQARFPGTNFEIPTDMFIKLPDLSKNKYGVDMAGDGNIDSFIADLPTKMDKLKEMFTNQRTEVDREIDDYTGKQKTAMTTERDRWKKLGQECKGMADQSARQIADLNKQNQDAAGKLASFCRKYDALRSSPDPACDKASKLAGDMDAIRASLPGNTQSFIDQYDLTCSQYNNSSDSSYAGIKCSDLKTDEAVINCNKAQNNSNSGSSSAGSNSKNIPVDIAKICNFNGTKKSDTAFLDALLKDKNLKASSDYSTQENKDKLIAAINSNDFSGVLKDGDNTPFAKVLAQLPQRQGNVSGASYCDDLYAQYNAPNAEDPTIKELQTNYDTASKTVPDDSKFATLNTAVDTATTNLAEKPDDTKLIRALTNAKADLAKAQALKDKADKAKADLSTAQSTARKEFKDKLSLSIPPDGTAGMSAKDLKSSILSDKIGSLVGEQKQSSCDSNNNLALNKSPFSTAVPTGFDASYLGASGTSK